MIPSLARAIGHPYRRANRVRLERYTIIPFDLFRVQNGPDVRLRDYDIQQRLGRRAFDFKKHADGLIHPAAGERYSGPNGCSVRPMGKNLLKLAHTFEGADALVYHIPKGASLPEILILLGEHTDHHAFQCATPMTLDELNGTLTRFLKATSERLSILEFLYRYGNPRPE
ncbi:hypothetical protein CALVIDRAFT_101183 [Calocera viscosa TUFC12733]|uniref:Tse2 ADP-ribosyltransferase toxin domain-containing protein n=1 Tax=Calocera viscosa (strain TUFC12733) TaxID=1330018 RepID=A0A167MM49_CALVF|nr:hypothetical protein CALVIDRAFT_101183 [Calocera viscosa TUFC12733]